MTEFKHPERLVPLSSTYAAEEQEKGKFERELTEGERSGAEGIKDSEMNKSYISQ